MDMDSWLHGYATTNAGGNNGFMCGYAAGSCSPAADLGDEQQEFLSSQIQHHIKQISMRMEMEDEAEIYMSSNDGGAATIIGMHDPIVEGLLDDAHHAGTCSFPSSSSSSLSLSACSASLCSPESISAQHILATPAVAAGGCNQQYPEVSSHVPLFPPPVVPYGHQYTNLQAPESPAKTTGAFKPYTGHHGPNRVPKHGACGQRMLKTAMSVLSKMHEAARYSHSQQQYYFQAAPAPAAAVAVVQPPTTVNQLQHMFSERKRREKLNDSFHALRVVLPPGSKKDKTSILIRAREYVRSLEAKVAALEEKNKSLESRLTRHDGRRKNRRSGGEDDHDSGETTKVQVEITRAANEEVFTLKIAVRSPSSSPPPNMTDAVFRTLQCLKEQIGYGVSLVAMSTSTSGGGAGPATRAKNASPRSVLTMQIKSPGTDDWEEQPVRDAVAKVVADALTTTMTPPPATSTACSGFGEASQLIIS